MCIRLSAEWFAAMLEATCILLDAANIHETGDQALYSARATQVIGDLLSEARTQRLIPHARRGLKVAAGGRKGAAQVNPLLQEKARREHAEWLNFARTLDPKLSHHAASRRVAARFGASVETVRKALPKKPW